MIFSLSRMPSAVNALNDSAQSPAWSRKALPSATLASESVSERASPANTSGGRPESSRSTASSATSSGHSGCCTAGRLRQESGDQGEPGGAAAAVIGIAASEVGAGDALAGRALERAALADLVQLLLRHGLLREERGLDAVEQALEPADELGLRQPQLRLGRRLARERERHVLQLLLQL